MRAQLWRATDLGEGHITRPLGDLLAVVACDLPDMVSTIKREDAEAAGLDPDALLARAIDRIDDGLPVRTQDLDDATVVYFGDSHFVASRVLALERFFEVPDAGALVAVPNRHVIAVHPFRGWSAIVSVPALAAMAHRLWDAGPGRISPSLYWWRAGALARLETAEEDGELKLKPPAEFVRALTALEDAAD